MSQNFKNPTWLSDVVTPGIIIKDEDELMRTVLRVASLNARHGSGGPFAAILATDPGEIVSIGVNQVVASHDATAHAELLAIRQAGSKLKSYSLRAEGLPHLKLFTSCAPCIMCTGAIHWAGIPEVIASARSDDAEAIGFIEGTKVFNVTGFLQDRGISYRADFLRGEAIQVFRNYDGPIYNG
jgi:tRNA(Arg) A34 adenosine deaminase TadA